MRSIESNLARPSSSSTPLARRCTTSSATSPWMRQTYSRWMFEEGCIRALASSPSVVSSSRPVVLMSRRPTAIQREPFRRGRDSNTVGRPSGSSRVVTSPSGLLYSSTRAGSVRALATKTLPSSSTRSPLQTDWPVRATSPLTFTRPWAMRSSSARREPRPAWASTLCRRSSALAAAGWLPFSLRERTFLGVLLMTIAPARRLRRPLQKGWGWPRCPGPRPRRQRRRACRRAAAARVRKCP